MTEQKAAAGPTRKEIIQSMYTIVYVVVLVSIMRLLKLSMWGVIAFLCLLVFGFMFYQSIRYKNKFDLWVLIKNWIHIIVIVIILYSLSYFGFWGSILAIIFICSFMIFKRRKKFFEAMERIETTIYGKPLNKKNWTKEEFKTRTKKKIVWRKK